MKKRKRKMEKESENQGKYIENKQTKTFKSTPDFWAKHLSVKTV